MADKEVNVDSKYLEKLDEQVESFRKLGKSWGLTSEDIDRCVLLSLQKKIELPKATPARTFFGLVKTVCKLTIWLFGVLFLCSVCVSFHEPTQKFLSHNLEPYGYVILRTLRVMTLPISRNFNISNLYENGCLIDNPIFREEGIDCEICKNIKEVPVRGNDMPFQPDDVAQPFIIKFGLGRIVTFEDLKKAVLDDPNSITYRDQLVKSDNDSIKTVRDVFDKNQRDTEMNKFFHVEWISKKVATARLLRTMFTRPAFVPQTSEVAIEKTIFIDGSKTKAYSLHINHYVNCWYTQGYGSRTLVLIPYGDCVKECTVLKVTVHAGDIVYFSDQFWRLDSVPEGDTISVGFMGSFF